MYIAVQASFVSPYGFGVKEREELGQIVYFCYESSSIYVDISIYRLATTDV